MDNQLQINSEAGKKIAEARERKRWTQTEAADRLGLALDQTYSLRQYQKLEKGIFPKFKKEVVQKLDDILGTKVYELIYEHSFDQQPSREALGPSYREQLWMGKILPQENYFPLIPHKARAGYSRNYENVDYITDNFEFHTIPPGAPSTKGTDWRWFEVGGESMLPALYDGDYLLCSLVPHADWRDIEQYKVHVIVWKNDVSVKRVAIDKSDYILISENEEEEKQKRVPLTDVKEVWKVRRRITAQLPPTKRFKITV